MNEECLDARVDHASSGVEDGFRYRELIGLSESELLNRGERYLKLKKAKKHIGDCWDCYRIVLKGATRKSFELTRIFRLENGQ